MSSPNASEPDLTTAPPNPPEPSFAPPPQQPVQQPPPDQGPAQPFLPMPPPPGMGPHALSFQMPQPMPDAHVFPPPPHHHPLHQPQLAFGPPTNLAFPPMFPFAPFPQMQPVVDGWAQFVSPNGAPYYYNTITHATSWSQPVKQAAANTEELRPMKWVKLGQTEWMRVYTNTGQFYYHNTTTKASIWKLPEELAFLKDIPDSDTPAPPPTEPANSSANSSANSGATQPPTPSDALADGNLKDEGSEKESGEDEGGMTYAERVEIFKDMLRDKGVQPFSKWEKYLPKLHFDSRFTILPDMKQRKAVFEHFVKHYAEEQRMQKKINKQSQKQSFVDLISNPTPSPRDSYDSLKRKFGQDSRWTSVDAKLRRNWVDEVLGPIQRSHEQENEKLRQAFRELLDETNISATALWNEVQGTVCDDERYIALGAQACELIFQNYQVVRLEAAAKAKLRETQLKQQRKGEEEERRQREESNRKREAEKQAQVEKWTTVKDKDNAAAKMFVVLLREHITSRKLTFEAGLELLKADPRYTALLLNSEQQRQMFQNHCDALNEAVQESFKALLKEREAEIPIGAKWEEIPESITEDSRFKDCSEEFGKEWFSNQQQARWKQAKSDFKALLTQLNLEDSTHKLKLGDVKDKFRNDPRYQAMAANRSERDEMIESFLERAKDAHKHSRSHHTKRHKHRR